MKASPITVTWMALLLCLLPLGAAQGLTVLGTEWEGSLRWTGASQSDLPDAQAGVLSNELMFRLPLALGGSLEWVPSLSLGMGYYRLDAGRPVVTDIELRDITALVPVLEMPLRWRFLRFSGHSYALSAGLAAELPVPIEIADPAVAGELIADLYGNGRFLLPFLGFSGRWMLGDRFHLSSGAAVYLPLHRLWDGSGAPFYDHLSIAFRLGLFFPLE